MTWPKPVIFTTRLGPNFLWHILTVAKVGYDSGYADRYAANVSSASVETLRRHAPRLRFGNGASGAMTAFFTFLPSWLHLESHAEFTCYFETVARCLREGSFASLSLEFPQADWTDAGFRHLPGMRFPRDPEAEQSFTELSAAYLDSFESFATLVWPEARAAMSGRVAELTAWFDKRDYVAAWEAAHGKVFLAPQYEITLCHSNLNGPDHNSLGYSGNLFYFDKPFTRTWQFVSHEIGTHLLHDLVVAAYEERCWRPDCLYKAYETLVMFLNSQVLALQELAYDLPSAYDHRGLLALYADLSDKQLPLAGLLRRGAEYLEARAASIPDGEESRITGALGSRVN